MGALKQWFLDSPREFSGVAYDEYVDSLIDQNYGQEDEESLSELYNEGENWE